VTGTTEPGWRVVAVERRRPTARTKQLTAFAGPDQELTVLGLDAAGGALNGVSPIEVTYAIGGLPAGATFNVVVWNRTGDGRNEVVGTVAANNAGIATLAVPLHAVFALTTKPVSLV
jgi:hypothetical protein